MVFKGIKNFVIAGSVLACGLALADGLSNDQVKQVEKVVSQYISEHPEAIIQSLQSYQQQQMSRSVQKTQTSSREHVEALFHQAADPVIGNPKAKVTVVEFFDYQCGHCIGMQSTFKDLVKSNPNVKVVFKEFPIRGPVSELAAKAALAAHQVGKYSQLHDAFMEAAAKGPLTEEMIYSIAQANGLDVTKLKQSMQSDVISQQIKNTYVLAQQLELMGTPAIFIAPSNVSKTTSAENIIFIPGEVDKDRLNQMINQLSKG